MAEFTTIGIIGKLRDPRIEPTLRALARHLKQRKRTVLVERATAAVLEGEGEVVTRAELAKRCDLAVVVGGDGTLLNAGRFLAPAGVPILGVNRGRLGFMVDVAPEDMRGAFDAVLKGRCVRERRLMLSTEIRRGLKVLGPFTAVNDVVIRNQAAIRMLEFETWLDDEFISLHRADGVIIASPTGSTAYALSGGGPVLHPGLDAVALVPICPHTLSDRPVVVGTDKAVRIVLGGDAGARAMCTHDGQQSETLAAGDAVVVSRSPHTLELIHPESYRYFDILRSKLHWGRARAAEKS
ncbi:MAG TPA: NAD(+) kinase [Candidatus Binatia bacterium]|nr:NAD(+) kinase [Candidatus Binatia bacterium]